MPYGAFGEQWPYTNFHTLNLDWILSRIKQYESDFETMKEETLKLVNDILGERTAELDIIIKDLKDELDKIASGAYMDEYVKALSKWIDNNLQCLVSRVVKYVFFGLTDDGHFCAHIPCSWDFITFDTINFTFICFFIGRRVI